MNRGPVFKEHPGIPMTNHYKDCSYRKIPGGQDGGYLARDALGFATIGAVR